MKWISYMYTYFPSILRLLPHPMPNPTPLGRSSQNTRLSSLFSSVQFSHSVMSNSLPLHGLQHARLTWPSPTPGDCSNSCPSSQWCHPTISFSVDPFSSCPQSFPASGSFPMSQFFTWGGQIIGFSFSISPSNEYSGLISFRKSLQSKGLSRVFSSTTVQKHKVFGP